MTLALEVCLAPDWRVTHGDRAVADTVLTAAHPALAALTRAPW